MTEWTDLTKEQIISDYERYRKSVETEISDKENTLIKYQVEINDLIKKVAYLKVKLSLSE